ncbi:GNAT family N-acetyltransferase [Microlunatus sp. GCM10028923]|uniref:GNAT family N-acetyltransferase n=1 Tax=Microlunatus sp. GCM10028923 TaxID=3273400 RepID=UPI00361E7673
MDRRHGCPSGLRRGGVGRALLARLERWAVELGFGRVWVVTERGPAVGFYESCGWVVDRAATVEAGAAGRGTVLVKAVR